MVIVSFTSLSSFALGDKGGDTVGDKGGVLVLMMLVLMTVVVVAPTEAGSTIFDGTDVTNVEDAAEGAAGGEVIVDFRENHCCFTCLSGTGASCANRSSIQGSIRYA